ncbi:uncharacterized protein [Montipora capricornis]|uniref:uncharacterized protein n=1 Tax=Montipora capricornis TaxID=246305 RepID=UPI0035F12E1E
MNGVPLSSKSGESYGILQEVCCTTQSGKGMIQLTFRQDGSSHKKRKVTILHSRYYDRFHSSPPFNECASKDADHLAEELSKALNVHMESSSPQSSQLFHPEKSVLAVNSAENSKEHRNASTVDTPPNIDSQTFLSHDTETPVATNQPQRHKKRLSFTPEDQVLAKKSKKDTCSSLMQSCDDCLVSASSHFINIDKLELPSKVRQFRRVNESFLNSLEAEMERNPAGSYGALFVVAKGLSSKIEWKEEEKNKHSYMYEVLGGTHLSLATKRLHEKYPENPHFAGRMSRIYVGLSDEQAVYLGGMHQHSSMFQHEVTYREEDVVSEIKDVVELVVRINFKRLMTIFNIVFICPVGIYCEVQEAVSLQGAAKTQCGFIVNKIPPLAREDLLMTEVVQCFLVCHWAVSYNKLTERHVSRAATNVIEVIRDGSCQPRELYESLIETFSKEGDLVLDIGSANGNGMLAAVRLKRPSVSINKHTTEDMRWHLLENIREKNHFPLE